MCARGITGFFVGATKSAVLTPEVKDEKRWKRTLSEIEALLVAYMNQGWPYSCDPINLTVFNKKGPSTDCVKTH